MSRPFISGENHTMDTPTWTSTHYQILIYTRKMMMILTNTSLNLKRQKMLLILVCNLNVGTMYSSMFLHCYTIDPQLVAAGDSFGRALIDIQSCHSSVYRLHLMLGLAASSYRSVDRGATFSTNSSFISMKPSLKVQLS